MVEALWGYHTRYGKGYNVGGARLGEGNVEWTAGVQWGHGRGTAGVAYWVRRGYSVGGGIWEGSNVGWTAGVRWR